METIHCILDSIQQENQPGVLATIIGVEGSAYRKVGASMLFLSDGKQIGILSGGCLEQDLAAHAAEVLATGRSHTFLYDTSTEDDLSWGHGLGCNGRIRVLLEPVDAWMREQLLRLKSCLDQGVSVLSYRKLNAEVGMDRAFFTTYTGEAFGNTDEADFVQDIVNNRIQPSWKLGNGVRFLPTAGASYYVHLYLPKPRIYIFGAGPDARSFVQFACNAGFAVTVCDWREALCSKDHFPQADEFLVGAMAEFAAKLHFGAQDAVVLMTHHFQHDRLLLEVLLQRELFYLGVLGPRKRTSRLLGGAAIPDYVHSPIGLPIGSEGPEEIAISILAEIISKLRLGKTKKTGVVHERK